MKDLSNCKTLNDIARQEFGKANYTNREKCKKILAEAGIDWKGWLESKKGKEKRCCLNCGKELNNKRNKFCNNSCSASYNNKLRKKKETHICENCGKEFTCKRNNANRFCSTKCQMEYRSKEYIKRWKNGEESGLSGEYGISRYIRNYLLNKCNYECEKCGWGEINKFTGNVPLEIHHVDGDYSNNKEENLQVLCPNCHSLTKTYKSHNKNGRKGRIKYYN